VPNPFFFVLHSHDHIPPSFSSLSLETKIEKSGREKMRDKGRERREDATRGRERR
jgi:hypothetical protein